MSQVNRSGIEEINCAASGSSMPETSGERHFDIDLPAQHSYLGEMEQTEGYTIFDEGTVLRLLAKYTGTVVFPGTIVPMYIDNALEISIMKDFTKEMKLFVLLFANQRRTDMQKQCVIMEIVHLAETPGDMRLKAVCRQRARVLDDTELVYVSEDSRKVTVRVCGEYLNSTPFCDTQMLTLRRRRSMDKKMYMRYHSMQYTFPTWVYEKNHIPSFVEKIHNRLSRFSDIMPRDAQRLCYWFAQNYQLSQYERLRMLDRPTVLDQLKFICRTLDRDHRYIYCYRCNNSELMQLTDLIVMCRNSLQTHFATSNGRVYEIMTGTAVENCILMDDQSNTFCWFEGYTSKMMACYRCKRRVGWQFESDVLTPKIFYGLATVDCTIAVSEVVRDTELHMVDCRNRYTRDHSPTIFCPPRRTEARRYPFI